MKKRIKRICIKLGHPILKVYWYFRRPNTTGVKCLLWNGNKVLLIKMSYGHGLWTLPGGGVKRNESPEQAVRREVLEEVGVTELSDLSIIGSYQTVKEYKNDTVHCFTATFGAEVLIDQVEVIQAALYSIQNLPINRAKQVDAIIKMYEQQ